uniref:RNA-dependent RNA polymerase n=1 Tax=Chromera velia CCMP2878 TaxID=1169474 RepID=A0A0G4FRH0_9ALVE|eukprot:Cvel_441.t1-p1 / transcript=Cvel_441.t1 / gene=Cvel_441 / organism=Chromera_velia_CCMP2878 / gene_product=Probable RNA-dependent RNA polymerase 1, putative / transcript_product=Probable RNA-dependent RNA polymerase 1, putative / location=Cvel_scaffold14:88965-96091(-) / protein_length=944 / sequence_SO=supercontig / SO=protein_coding / is_pseudo=false
MAVYISAESDVTETCPSFQGTVTLRESAKDTRFAALFPELSLACVTYGKPERSFQRDSRLQARTRYGITSDEIKSWWDNASQGIRHGSFIFFPFCISDNAARDGTVWFIGKSVAENAMDPIDVNKIAAMCGFENRGQNMTPKEALRIGLLFSRGQPVEVEGVDDELVDDIERNGFVFSDGNGSAGEGVFRSIWKTVGETAGRTDVNFTTFQLRYKGYKGTLTMDKNLPAKKIEFPRSMLKFKGTEAVDALPMHILQEAKIKRGQLNCQLMHVFRARGTPAEVFLDLQTQQFETLQKFSNEPKFVIRHLKRTARQLRKAGITGKADQCDRWRELLRAGLPIVCIPELVKFLQNKVMGELRASVRDGEDYAKLRIPVEDAEGNTRAWWGMAVIDKRDCLEHDEIFVQVPVRGKGEDDEDRFCVVTGPLASAKHPLYKISGVRIVTGVDRPELRHLKGVIVFSARGPHPKLMELSGADADGDWVFITDYPPLLSSITDEPPSIAVPAKKEKKSEHQQEQRDQEDRAAATAEDSPPTPHVPPEGKTFNHTHRDLAASLSQNALGLLDWHLMRWLGHKEDSELEGAKWRDYCEKVGDLAQEALDCVKTGEPVTKDHILETFGGWPDYISCADFRDPPRAKKCVWDFEGKRDSFLQLNQTHQGKRQCEHHSRCFLGDLVRRAVKKAAPPLTFPSLPDPLERLWVEREEGPPSEETQRAAGDLLQWAREFFDKEVKPKAAEVMFNRPADERTRTETERVSSVLGVPVQAPNGKWQQRQRPRGEGEVDSLRGDFRVCDQIRERKDLSWNAWEDFLVDVHGWLIDEARRRAQEGEGQVQKEAHRLALALYVAQKRGRAKGDPLWPQLNFLWFPFDICHDELLRLLEEQSSQGIGQEGDGQRDGSSSSSSSAENPPAPPAPVFEWIIHSFLGSASRLASCCGPREGGREGEREE